MSEIFPLHPSALSAAPALRRRLPVLAVLGLTLLLGACRAPGMKFNTQAYDKETRTQVNGQDVTLHPLNPETLKVYGARPASTGGQGAAGDQGHSPTASAPRTSSWSPSGITRS